YPTGIPGITVSNLSSGSLQHAVINTPVLGGVKLTRDVSFDINSKMIKIVDTLQNVSGAPLLNVVMLDSTDPDPDSISGNYNTLNDVVSVVGSNDMVIATGPGSSLSVGFGAESGFQIPSATGFDNRNAYGFLTVVDPNGASGDIAINLAQNYGTLNAGQSK